MRAVLDRAHPVDTVQREETSKINDSSKKCVTNGAETTVARSLQLVQKKADNSDYYSTGVARAWYMAN